MNSQANSLWFKLGVNFSLLRHHTLTNHRSPSISTTVIKNSTGKSAEHAHKVIIKNSIKVGGDLKLKIDFADFVFTHWLFQKQREEVRHDCRLNIYQELMYIKFGWILPGTCFQNRSGQISQISAFSKGGSRGNKFHRNLWNWREKAGALI